MKGRIEKVKGGAKEFFKNLFKVLRRPDMIVLPGNLSFFFVLAVIPLISLITYLASLLNLSVDFLYDFVAHSFSDELAQMVLGTSLVNKVGFQFFVTLLIGFYVASNGADSIITASNTIYGIENKSWIKRRIKAFGLTFLIVLLLIFMLIVPVFGNTIITLIKEVHFKELISKNIVAILELIKGPASWVIMFIIIRVIYAIAPNKKVKGRVINYGAIFTTVCWILGTKIYSIYVTNYAEYSTLYGSLASIVVLMIWFYYLSYIFTIGIALNSQQDENNLLKTGTIKKKK